ncbi:MAG: C10 family peptidase [Bacteroidales bacterium]|nr:C10 family peptidase [Bacteroidales bacterium]
MKRILLFVATAMLAGAVSAAPVGVEKASTVAHHFWTATLHGKADVQLKHAGWQYDAVHLFMSEAGGWVMVAADDVARPILAYSTSGSFNPLQPPAAMTDFLYVYQNEVEAVRHTDLPAHNEWELLSKGGSMKDGEEETVGPLLATTWYQTSPYNQLCPSGCMTGCEATAMAQVLKYWNYPAFGNGTHSYNDPNGHGIQTADFADTRYDWANMPNRLTGASTAAQKTAVATLMYHCGVAVNMSYSPSLSGAVMTSLAPALTSFFHYRNTATLKAKGTMSNSDWTDTLIAELRCHRPIIYGGEGPMGGHVFVCDGFDTRHYLHFNLGEDGAGDGFYQVGAINYGMYSFNNANDGVFGIQPEYGVYFNTNQLDFGRAAGQQQVWISTSDTSSRQWSVASSQDWVVVSEPDFDHLGQITVSVSDNNSGAERTATVTLSQGPHTAVLTILQAAYDPATDYCPLTVEMENTHNEPWAGDAYLSFESTSGLLYGTARHTANSGASTATVRVAPHDVMVRWHSGGALDRYINYRIKNQYGEVLVEVNNAYFDGADELLSWPCAHLAISDADEAPVSIGPNPTTGLLRVDTDNLLGIDLLDLQGRRLLHSSANSLDLSALPAGIYHLRILSANGIAVRKIVKK